MVDEDLCIGCGHCSEVCPAVFELVDEKSNVVRPEGCDACDCQEAIDTCPVQAIGWREYQPAVNRRIQGGGTS